LVTGEGSVISNSGGLTVGNAGPGNTLVVSDGSSGGLFLGGVSTSNTVAVGGGGLVWSNTTGLVISDGTFTGGVVSNGVIMPPILLPNPVLIINRLGELAIGRGGSGIGCMNLIRMLKRPTIRYAIEWADGTIIICRKLWKM
jgi:hypothetical protein